MGTSRAPSAVGEYRAKYLLHNVVRIFLCAALLLIATSHASGAITFVQRNYAVPQTQQASVAIVYTGAQTAGNLNVVVVGWNDTTARLSSVTDSKGNVYTLALGPTTVAGALSQSIYYARNIAAATAQSNTVTVQFTAAASFPDIRVLEYSGIDAISPFDGSAAATGTSKTSSTPTVTTTNTNDLLFAANTVTSSTSAPGSGFTNRVITTPNGDIAEDRIVTTTGAYSGNAALKSTGKWVMQLVAFKAAGGIADTTPPTAPSNLAAIATGTSSINLTWTASTDNVGVTGYRVERCQGAGCATFTQVATLSGTTYSDTGLLAAMSYSYRMRAADAAGNLSPYSSIASATTNSTADTMAPTAPSNLTASAIGTSSINLSWIASTDNVGVTGYRVERCQGSGCTSFVQVATPSGTTYNDTGLLPGTSYTYRVRANDTAANLSAYSNTATASTAADTTAPSTPSNLAATVAGSSVINLTWTASTDNVGVTGYRVERCQGAGCTSFAQIAAPPGTTFKDTGLLPSTSYSYRVRAADAASNLSTYSNTASATTAIQSATMAFVQVAYATPQSAQSSVRVTYPAAQTGGNLNVVVVGWNDSTAAVTSVTDSKGNAYALAVGPTFVPGLLSQSIYYAKNIAAASANGNIVTVQFSVPAQFADVRTLEYVGLDTATPLDVSAAATGSGNSTSTPITTTNANDLLFAANTVTTSNAAPGNGFTSRVITSPDGDIAEDRVVSAIGTYTASATLNSSGSWVIQIVAFKGAGAPADTTPPSAPSDLTASAIGGSTIDLAWTAATDNVGVTGYRVERCLGGGCSAFAEIATSSGTSFSDSGLSAGASYSYRARATDTAANLGPYSNTASATTGAADTQPPSAPTQLTATAVSTSQINLAWTASTDNVGVTAYRVLRCQATGSAVDCPNFVKVLQQTGTATTFGDNSGLLPGTTYRYIVQAVDAAGNLSAASNEASATTSPMNSGLVAAYSFDEGTGTTVADASGNGNQGTLLGTAWVAGKYNRALAFNGTSSFITINDSGSLRLTNGMTLEAWVNPSSVSSAWRDVIYKGNDNYYLMGTSDNAGWPAIGGTFAGANANLYTTSVLALNTWSHVAATYDGSVLRLYVNGVLTATRTQSGALATSTNPLQIGGDSLYGQVFQGAIDEVRIYNRGLSQAEIQADMNAPIGNGIGPPSNLTANAVSGTQIDLNWTASAGGQPVASYQIERCAGIGCAGFAPLASTSGTNFSDTTIAPNGTYRYRVRAIDSGGNASIYSNIADAFTGLSLHPKGVALTPTRTQQYTITGANPSGVTWAVDGTVGGSLASGTISSTGLYTPPPAIGSHTVTATTADGTQSASATVYITNYAGKFTHHNDNFRTGANVNETVLTPGNVNPSSFGKLFTYQLDGNMHASPLYVANVNIPGSGFRNVIYAATEHDSVYALDADALTTTPLWRTSFINPAAGVTTVPADDTGECCDIAVEIGITGTPVIDAATGTLYVVAKTKEPSGYVQRLHALDITNGAEKFGGPVVIQASIGGSGAGSQGGQVPFDSLRENQRPALLLSNGGVYMAFASHGDRPPWHGWVIGYNATTLQQIMAFNATPNGSGGGIWQSGGGVAADTAGNIYLVTGNGTFNANSGGLDFGDSFVKIDGNGVVRDYFTPHNQSSLNAANFDLASSNLMLLPDQPGARPHLALSAGKNETIHVVDRDNMGHFNSTNDNQIVQSLVNIFPNGTPEPGNYNAPVYFNGTVYFGPVNDSLMAFPITNGLLSLSPGSRTSEVYTYPGGAISASGNGSTNGILWAVQRNGSVAPGGLRAYDAANLSTQLYSSDQAGTRDTLDVAAKFSVPLVANGKVYVGSMTQLTVYGLLP